MRNNNFTEHLSEKGELKNHYLNDLSSNLEVSQSHFKKLAFYIILIPLIYISVIYSTNDEISFLGVQLNTSLLTAIFPIIYSYIAVRAFSIWLFIKDLKDMKNDIYKTEMGAKFNHQYTLLNPYSLTNSFGRKIIGSNACIILPFAIPTFLSSILINTLPLAFLIYLIHNLYVTDLNSDFLYYSSITITHLLNYQEGFAEPPIISGFDG